MVIIKKFLICLSLLSHRNISFALIRPGHALVSERGGPVSGTVWWGRMFSFFSVWVSQESRATVRMVGRGFNVGIRPANVGGAGEVVIKRKDGEQQRDNPSWCPGVGDLVRTCRKAQEAEHMWPLNWDHEGNSWRGLQEAINLGSSRPVGPCPSVWWCC